MAPIDHGNGESQDSKDVSGKLIMAMVGSLACFLVIIIAYNALGCCFTPARRDTPSRSYAQARSAREGGMTRGSTAALTLERFLCCIRAKSGAHRDSLGNNAPPPPYQAPSQPPPPYSRSTSLSCPEPTSDTEQAGAAERGNVARGNVLDVPLVPLSGILRCPPPAYVVPARGPVASVRFPVW